MLPRFDVSTQIGHDRQQTRHGQHPRNHQHAKDIWVLQAEDEHSTNDEHDDDAEDVGPRLVDWRVATLIGNQLIN